MKHLKLFVAFGLGFLTVMALSLVAGVTVGRAKTRDVSALRGRVRDLEAAAQRGELAQTVVAPFRVVDGAHKEIFFVGNAGTNAPNALVKVSRTDDPQHGAVWMGVRANGGGYFEANSLLPGQSVELNLHSQGSLAVTESDENRIILGKNLEQGNYRLIFQSGGKTLAAIGEGRDTHAGLVLVADSGGIMKAELDVSKEGRGRVSISSDGSNVLARLTQGEHGEGLLLICTPSSCTPPMVAAGTNDDDVGSITTGPRFYNQGITGASGSFLIGKK